jgi:hypothetical protein
LELDGFDIRKLRTAYNVQRNDAKKRGIEFLLTFSEWLDIWVSSGHLHERGRKKGQYCMARKGPDIGPYAVGNVRIERGEKNKADALYGNSHTLGHKLTAEHKAKVGKKGSENHESKLCDESVREIRIALSKGVNGRKLGEQYGVDRQTIWKIKTGKSWTHVQ